MSGKFEILSGNCQGNVREFCFHWSVATLVFVKGERRARKNEVGAGNEYGGDWEKDK